MLKSFKPMLAGKCEPSKLRYPLIMQPKYDGIRCLINNGVAYTRSLKEVRNKHIQVMVRGFGVALDGLDGELIVGEPTDEMCYRNTSSGVMSELGFPIFFYYVFDHWQYHTDSYEARRMRVLECAQQYPDFVKIVPDILITDETMLLEQHQALVKEGHEGTILRDPKSPYKFNRSTTREGYLIKFKDFVDAEAVIVDFEPKYHNANEATLNELGYTKRSSAKDGLVALDTLGSLLVKMPGSDTIFNVGTGFDDATRKWIWDNREKLKGKIIKYKFFEQGKYSLPRFPVFLGFRDELDVS